MNVLLFFFISLQFVSFILIIGHAEPNSYYSNDEGRCVMFYDVPYSPSQMTRTLMSGLFTFSFRRYMVLSENGELEDRSSVLATNRFFLSRRLIPQTGCGVHAASFPVSSWGFFPAVGA